MPSPADMCDDRRRSPVPVAAAAAAAATAAASSSLCLCRDRPPMPDDRASSAKLKLIRAALSALTVPDAAEADRRRHSLSPEGSPLFCWWCSVATDTELLCSPSGDGLPTSATGILRLTSVTCKRCWCRTRIFLRQWSKQGGGDGRRDGHRILLATLQQINNPAVTCDVTTRQLGLHVHVSALGPRQPPAPGTAVRQ